MSKENSVTTFRVKSYERWHHIWVMIYFKLCESYGNPRYFVHAADIESAAVTESSVPKAISGQSQRATCSLEASISATWTGGAGGRPGNERSKHHCYTFDFAPTAGTNPSSDGSISASQASVVIIGQG